MSTLLIHAARALTPTTEISDAGILVREDVIEAIGPRSGMTLPVGAQEIRAPAKWLFLVSLTCTSTGPAATT